jgi:hypothetical protein
MVQNQLDSPTGELRAELILPAWVDTISQILKDHPAWSNGEKSCRQAKLLVLLAFRVNTEMEVLEAILVEVVIVEEPGIGTGSFGPKSKEIVRALKVLGSITVRNSVVVRSVPGLQTD